MREQADSGAGAAGKGGPRRAGELRLERLFDPPEVADGLRVLVDRLWPRALAKAAAAVDLPLLLPRGAGYSGPRSGPGPCRRRR